MHKKKAHLSFCLLFLIQVTTGQTILLSDYYPLRKDSKQVFYVSHITKTDTLKDKDCTRFCKSLLIGNKEVFYFDERHSNNGNTIIGSESFCDGVFYYENGDFKFSPIFWMDELRKANLDYFETLFPSKIQLDSVYKYNGNCPEKRTYEFNGFEQVIIKGKKFQDCLKLTIVQNWKTAQYIDTVWFQKGVGVVKWLRSTGRLEEIKL